MRVSLVFPPQGHFTQPYLSLPSLAAYLRAETDAEVSLIDANIESYDHFLSRDRLALSLERVRAADRLRELDARPALSFSDMASFQRFSEIDLIGESVVEGIEEAKRVLRTPELFYDYERYLWAGRTVEQGLRLFSAEFAPTVLSAHGFVTRYRVERSDEVIAALTDEAANPYIEYFHDHVLPRLQREDPDLIGISVTFASQAIPALTLAKAIKEWKPEVHITVGGGLLAYVGDKLARREELWSLIDSMVLLEGERPLAELVEVVAGQRELSDVANVLYRDKASGEVITNPQRDPLDIKTLPTPDFDGMPLEKYLSPELVLPLAITRGCYWGKCVFCTLYTVIGPGYRGRGIEQTVEDIRALKEKYGTRHFYMVIEDLPPNMAKALPDAILEANLDIDWWCDARLEHEAFTEEVCEQLYESGCRRMAFGYESSSERVLEAMCKGIDPQKSMELVHRVRKVGISVTLYVMVGFPTETLAEARQTLATLLENRDSIQEVSVRVFYLDETSEIFRRREEFDIAEIYPDPDADLQVYYDFRTSSGMTRVEARRAYLEFTEALRSHFPVFQNTNMLYHELKSHYFLYLAKFEGWDELRANVLEAPRKGSIAEASAVRRRGGLVRRELSFDRSEVDRVLGQTDSEAVRPRYQSDIWTAEDLRTLDRETAPLQPQPSTLVYDAASGEVHCFSPAAAEVLERCDGTLTPAQVADHFPSEVRADAIECVRTLSSLGLLEQNVEEVVR